MQIAQKIMSCRASKKKILFLSLLTPCQMRFKSLGHVHWARWLYTFSWNNICMNCLECASCLCVLDMHLELGCGLEGIDHRLLGEGYLKVLGQIFLSIKLATYSCHWLHKGLSYEISKLEGPLSIDNTRTGLYFSYTKVHDAYFL